MGQQNEEGSHLLEATQISPLLEIQSLYVVYKETCKTILFPNCSLQFTAASLPHSCLKGSRPAEVEFVNPWDAQHVRIAMARIVHRTLTLSRKSCQALERCILLGLCCIPGPGGQPRAGVAEPREEMLELCGGIGAVLWGSAKVTDQPHYGGAAFSQLHGSLKPPAGVTQYTFSKRLPVVPTLCHHHKLEARSNLASCSAITLPLEPPICHTQVSQHLPCKQKTFAHAISSPWDSFASLDDTLTSSSIQQTLSHLLWSSSSLKFVPSWPYRSF